MIFCDCGNPIPPDVIRPQDYVCGNCQSKVDHLWRIPDSWDSLELRTDDNDFITLDHYERTKDVFRNNYLNTWVDVEREEKLLRDQYLKLTENLKLPADFVVGVDWGLDDSTAISRIRYLPMETKSEAVWLQERHKTSLQVEDEERLDKLNALLIKSESLLSHFN
jgi:hypothetical protein